MQVTRLQDISETISAGAQVRL